MSGTIAPNLELVPLNEFEPCQQNKVLCWCPRWPRIHNCFFFFATCTYLPTIFPEPKFCDSSVSDKRKGCGSRSLPDLMHSVMNSNDTTGIPFLTAVLPLYDDRVLSELPVTRKLVLKKRTMQKLI